jgi:hypothetical protein
MPTAPPRHRGVAHARARVANAVSRGADPATLADRRRDLAAVKLAGAVEEWLATWQPTAEQVRTVSAILDPYAVTGTPGT